MNRTHSKRLATSIASIHAPAFGLRALERRFGSESPESLSPCRGVRLTQSADESDAPNAWRLPSRRPSRQRLDCARLSAAFSAGNNFAA